MTPRKPWIPLLLGLGLALPLLVIAQEGPRDPTAWPEALRSAMAASTPASGASAERAGIRQVIFSNGRGYVVQRGRRYAVGEQLDGARIERITEQAVWLREAGQLRRESLYSGVEKRPPAPARAAPKHSKEKQP